MVCTGLSAKMLSTDLLLIALCLVCLQSLAVSATFVYSMHLLMHWQLFIMAVFATVGTAMFFEAERLATVQAKSAISEIQLTVQPSSQESSC